MSGSPLNYRATNIMHQVLLSGLCDLNNWCHDLLNGARKMYHTLGAIVYHVHVGTLHTHLRDRLSWELYLHG